MPEAIRSDSDDKPVAQLIELPKLGEAAALGEPISRDPLDLLRNVKVRLAVIVGETRLTVSELAALKDGAVLKLDRLVDQPVDILLENQVVARGHLVAVDDNFGVRISEIHLTTHS